MANTKKKPAAKKPAKKTKEKLLLGSSTDQKPTVKKEAKKLAPKAAPKIEDKPKEEPINMEGITINEPTMTVVKNESPGLPADIDKAIAAVNDFDPDSKEAKEIAESQEAAAPSAPASPGAPAPQADIMAGYLVLNLMDSLIPLASAIFLTKLLGKRISSKDLQLTDAEMDNLQPMADEAMQGVSVASPMTMFIGTYLAIMSKKVDL